MQLQKLFALSSLVLLGNVVGTLADLEPDEVPKQCQQVCQSVVQRSQQCDKNTQDDHAEKECMCKLKDASTVVPQCEACVAKYHSEVSDHSNPHDNDVHDIIQFCHFSTTTYTGGGMPATATDSTASATESSGTTATGAMASTSTMTSSESSASDSAVSSTSETASSSGGTSASASSSTPTNTGGASVMNAGGNALSAFGVAFACVAALF